MKYFVYPYTQGSKSAKALAEALDGKRILREGSNYKYNKMEHILINWGASDCPYNQALNYKIGAVVDKREFFKRLKGTGITPQYATTLFDAVTTLPFPIFCRKKATGHDGEGIVIADKPNQLVECSLYVEGIVGKNEYRVHVGRQYDGKVAIIGAQKKVSKAKTAEMTNIPADPRIRCGDTTGFVWTVSGQPVQLPTKVAEVAIKVMEKFPELTFGGFDIIESTGGNAYVLEVNSAPMATPETTVKYAEFFREYANQFELANLPKKVEAPVIKAVPVASTPSPASPKPEKVELVDVVKSMHRTTELLTCFLQQS